MYRFAKMLVISAATAFILFCVTTTSALAYSWTGDVTIKTVYPNGNFSGLPNGTIVRIVGAHNPENCAYGTYFFLDRAMGESYRDVLSVLLAAHVAGRKVDLLVEGCGASTWAGPLIKAVQMPLP